MWLSESIRSLFGGSNSTSSGAGKADGSLDYETRAKITTAIDRIAGRLDLTEWLPAVCDEEFRQSVAYQAPKEDIRLGDIRLPHPSAFCGGISSDLMRSTRFGRVEYLEQVFEQKGFDYPHIFTSYFKDVREVYGWKVVAETLEAVASMPVGKPMNLGQIRRAVLDQEKFIALRDEVAIVVTANPNGGGFGHG